MNGATGRAKQDSFGEAVSLLRAQWRRSGDDAWQQQIIECRRTAAIFLFEYVRRTFAAR